MVRRSCGGKNFRRRFLVRGRLSYAWKLRALIFLTFKNGGVNSSDKLFTGVLEWASLTFRRF